jgi:hypothetical protein
LPFPRFLAEKDRIPPSRYLSLFAREVAAYPAIMTDIASIEAVFRSPSFRQIR